MRSPGSRPACATPASRSAARSGSPLVGTVAWTVAASSIGATTAHAATATRSGRPTRPSEAALTAIYHHALATGFARAFLVAAGIMVLALIITIAAIRIQRADLGEVRS